jgi:hypothetical protein
MLQRVHVRILALSLPFFFSLSSVAFAQAPGEPPPPPAPVEPAEVPPTGPAHLSWTSGYHDDHFYLRSPDDDFRLFVQARVHVDWSHSFGAGVTSLPPGSTVNDGFFLRRARFEMGGEFFRVWQWQLGVEFAPSALSNPAANTVSQSCTPSPTTGALTCVNRETAVDATTVSPAPTDVFVNYGPSTWANVQVGQYYLPFTMENRISDNTTMFLERSMAVRDLGAPLQRDIGAMFWGESPDNVFYYAGGVFNGDGPNRPNVDNRYDLSGRVLARPLARTVSSNTKWAQIGLSARGGSRDAKLVGYDEPAMTTQEGFTFWRPTYTDSYGRLNHIIPSGRQWALGADAYVPFGIVEISGEFVYSHSDTREALDGLQLSPFTQRLGRLDGYAYYLQGAVWLRGTPELLGYPSYAKPVHLDLTKVDAPPEHGLQAAARFEQLHVNYDGSSRGGTDDSKTPTGDIDVTSFTLGLTYWATRHMRVSLNYGAYFFPGSAPTTPSETGGPVQGTGQRAIAPGQYLAKGVDNTARDDGHAINEISARFGVQF